MIACTMCMILDEVNADDPVGISQGQSYCRKHLLIESGVPYGRSEDQIKEQVREYKGPLGKLLT